MPLKKWNELPVELRRSESKRWNYLVDELGSESDTPEQEHDEG